MEEIKAKSSKQVNVCKKIKVSTHLTGTPFKLSKTLQLKILPFSVKFLTPETTILVLRRTRFMKPQINQINRAFTKASISAMIGMSVTFATAQTTSDRNALPVLVNGGYENFVASGSTSQGLPVLIGGGNHGSGDLRETFPWVDYQNGQYQVMGFNDMTIALGDDVYVFAETMKHSLSKKMHFEKKLRIEGTGLPEEDLLLLKMKGVKFTKNSNPQSNVLISFDLEFNTSEPVVRHEGIRYPRLIDFINNHYCGSSLIRATHSHLCDLFDSIADALPKTPGLTLKEYYLKLNRSGSLRITNLNGKSLGDFQVESLTGSLEKSDITVLATARPELTFHMQYDYVAIMPDSDNSTQCNKPFIGYVSGLLNKNTTLFHPILDTFFFLTSSTGFWIHPSEGKAVAEPIAFPPSNVTQIRNRGDVQTLVSTLTRLPLSSFEVSGLGEHEIAIGPGIFNRQLIRIKNNQTQCHFGGMLETQRPISNH